MPGRQGRGGFGGLTEVAAAVLSALGVLAAVWWWVSPEAYPLAEPNQMSLIAGAWRPELSLVLGLLGAWGTVTALAMRRRAGSPVPRGLVIASAGAQVLAFLGVASDAGVLSTLGYLCAIFGPVGLLVLVAVGARRHPPSRYVLAAVLLAGGVVGVATGMARPEVFAELGSDLAAGIADAAPRILGGAAAFGYGCVWLWALVRYVRRTSDRCVTCGRSGTTDTRGVARWGTWVTIAAAIGPLPYALIRMTWLTPWPVLGVDAEILAANPGMRLFGLSLGFAAIGGSVLTLGLIRPWGEVWPRWIPVLRGRPVPVTVPSALGLLVGAAVTVAGRSFAQLVLTNEWDWWMLLVFPFPVWGPLLIAASIAYYLRRRGRCRLCGVA